MVAVPETPDHVSAAADQLYRHDADDYVARHFDRLAMRQTQEIPTITLD